MVDRIVLIRAPSFRNAAENRKFFALPDLRELSLGKPRGLRARDVPLLPFL
jgi:hypothetical protein